LPGCGVLLEEDHEVFDGVVVATAADTNSTIFPQRRGNQVSALIMVATGPDRAFAQHPENWPGTWVHLILASGSRLKG
jgi:hypothetical protein